jgi:anthraniloyl-CoA monooxygenase
MKIVSIGGGPAGLYYAILAKQADPTRQVVVHERNRAGDTFGFGVVFSDQTLDNLARADARSHAEISAAFTHWEDIDVVWKGEVVRSRGHGFAGLERRVLLDILTRRAVELGVEVHFSSEISSTDQVEADLILAADGVNSGIRAALADELQPSIDWRPNRFVWLGTTLPLSAFTFFFRQNAHGLFRVHAYQFSPELSTFIVECTEATWRAAGMDQADEDATITYLEGVFRDDLHGHALLKNRSLWRQFPTVKNARWSTRNIVLVGDAAHTAHFSIGSGTKLALEDAIALHEAVEAHPGDIPTALQAYETARRPMVDKLQRAAQVSLEWFEGTERYQDLAPLAFTMSLLTRSLRVSHGNLGKRDPELMARVDAEFAGGGERTPPMLTSYSVRGMRFDNRIVLSPMCQYNASTWAAARSAAPAWSSPR